MNDKNIKMIALDIDGTIMKKDFTISDRVKSALKNASDAGIKVVLATGRMYSSTVDIAKELGLNTPIISYQGGLIKEFYNSDKVLLHHTIEDTLSRDIIAELRKFEVQINLYLNDKLYIESENALLTEYATKRNIIYKKIDDFESLSNIYADKILAIHESADHTTKVLDYLRSRFESELYLTKSTPFYCEIADNKVSKGNAILHLASYWNIDKSQIMTIGDQDNDIEMISVAGFGVAMGNATNALKEVADYLTDSVADDGAAKVIEKFVLS